MVRNLCGLADDLKTGFPKRANAGLVQVVNLLSTSKTVTKIVSSARWPAVNQLRQLPCYFTGWDLDSKQWGTSHTCILHDSSKFGMGWSIHISSAMHCSVL